MSRRAISWLAAAVLLVTPLQSLSNDSAPVLAMLCVRAASLVLLLVALRIRRIGPIVAGRVFLGIGLCDMVASAALLHPDPYGVVVEAICYGTVLAIFTLLIAPRRTRQGWSLAVTGLIIVVAGFRLLPDNALFLVQIVAFFVVHTTVVLALDIHTNRAEEAGALATTDPLTGLVNRRPAIERMTSDLLQSASDQIPSTVIMVDLDHFKQLNDTLGHEAGDDALRRVADELSHLVRGGDIVCRWGGEEFLILMPGLGTEAAAGVAERMRLGVERLGVTASFGVAEANNGKTVAEWVHRADSAMYFAKHSGRNQVVIDDRFASSEQR